MAETGQKCFTMARNCQNSWSIAEKIHGNRTVSNPQYVTRQQLIKSVLIVVYPFLHDGHHVPPPSADAEHQKKHGLG